MQNRVLGWGKAVRFGWIGVQIDIADVEDIVFRIGAILYYSNQLSERRFMMSSGDDSVLSMGFCLGRREKYQVALDRCRRLRSI